MNMKNFILKGDICFSRSKEELSCVEQGYLVCTDGICRGVFREIPQAYAGLSVQNWEHAMILPGLYDLHVHAPQYAFAGTGMDLELLQWLETRTFPEEERYADPEYARKAYGLFARKLKESATARACIFGTIHREATQILMEELEQTGLKTMVGKVSMDRNASAGLLEPGPFAAARSVCQWLDGVSGKYENVKPVVTPRFVPACTEELLGELGKICEERKLPVQSHLSENPSEIAWVKELCPWAESYAEVYEHFGLLGMPEAPAVMAHCVYSGESENEKKLLRENPVYIAHCPQSNTDLSSGIAPVRRYLEEGMQVGLGTDIAGGHKMSVFQTMAEAIQVSKLRWRLADASLAPLRTEEAFYLGTKGGGSFFGKVGSFEPGYELDAVIIDEERLSTPARLSMKERLERIIYLSEDRDVVGKYVAGEKIF